MTSYFADNVWLPHGWSSDVRLGVQPDGSLKDVAEDVERGDAQYLGSHVLPGMPNLHSHAFQRAMAGRAEHMTHPEDSFWTWREAMYQCAQQIGPDTLAAIAAQLYVEMLKCGYTAVCEFHYLHHRPDGMPYAPREAMADAILRAARQSGIGLTLLPTLYQSGGLDGRALSERQRRFRHEVPDFLRLIETLREREDGQTMIGIAFHSLRAVPEAAMREVLDSEIAREGPIHVHIAEQSAEVRDCLQHRGARPVAWLLDNAPVDPRWCLVHATHMDASETEALARSGAVAGLCPTTEANLGDGVFTLMPFLEAGGAIGVGSDSQVSISPIEELRWLEYGQRLVRRARNVVASHETPHVGENLWREALVGGAQAAQRKLGALAPGHRADLLVLDDAAPELAGIPRAHLLDALVFSGNRNLVRDVMVGGQWQVRGGRHLDEERIAERFREVMAAPDSGL
jgi:formimidoylglutamate deiminase